MHQKENPFTKRKIDPASNNCEQSIAPQYMQLPKRWFPVLMVGMLSLGAGFAWPEAKAEGAPSAPNTALASTVTVAPIKMSTQVNLDSADLIGTTSPSPPTPLPPMTREEEEQLLGLINTAPMIELEYEPKDPGEVKPLSLEDSSATVWDEIRRNFAIPDLDVPAVQAKERELMKGRRGVEAMLQRSQPYIYYITQECIKRGLPTELALLPFIESQFNPHARSPSAAVGLWQFIPGTGKRFDLAQNKLIDERKDLIESTRAALDYLEYLYDLHADWHLALLAYNLGEGAIARIARKVREDGLEPEFARLKLPTETMRYLPKLQAVKNLIADPQRFGYELPDIANKPYFAEIKRKSNVDLRELSKLTGIPLETFKNLNPAFAQPVVMASHTDRLLVPVEYANKVKSKLKTYQYIAPVAIKSKPVTHIVAKGDTLYSIGRKYGVEPSAVARLNRINARQTLKVGSRLNLPTGPLNLASNS